MAVSHQTLHERLTVVERMRLRLLSGTLGPKGWTEDLQRVQQRQNMQSAMRMTTPTEACMRHTICWPIDESKLVC